MLCPDGHSQITRALLVVTLLTLALLRCGGGSTGPDDRVIALDVEPETVRLPVGDSTDFTASFVHASGSRTPAEDVTWSSSKETVATVNATGRGRAEGSGRSRIVAEAGGLTAHAVVSVPGWFLVPPMPAGRRAGHAAALDGKVFYIGGNATLSEDYVATTFVFDSETETWSVGAEMPTARDQGAIAGTGDAIYVIGGVNPDAPNNGFSRLHQSERLGADGAWLVRAPMPTARGGARADTLGGRIYVVAGGVDGFTKTGVLEIYDLEANTWTSGASIPTLRQAFAIGTIGSGLYVAGGEDENRAASAVLEIFDGTSGAWSTGPPMPTARYNVASVVLDGILVVAGGQNAAASQLDAVEAFDPIAGAWRAAPNLPIARREASATVLDGVMYVLGGVISSVVTSRVDAYIP